MELIGRDRELDEVLSRLSERRLVTVIGPGGMGKTTLAQAASTRIAHRFPLGVHLVDLTRVESPLRVGGAIAGQLGFSSFDALLDAPADQPALLLIDNCEHVTAAAADAVAALLASCEAPTVLATSRSPLDVAGESLVLLGPLELPPIGSVELDGAAVHLFLERSRDAGGHLGDDELETVAELCRHLDGIPLAIEIAAARTRTMRPAEILALLADRVDVLARPRFRGEPRHRSVAETVDWSYRLLDEDAAGMFNRLGVFAGPFTASIAHAVGGDIGLTPELAAATLDTLVDSSLVVAERRGEFTQYRLLETVRRYALSRLDERRELVTAHDRFVDHVVAAITTIIADGGRRWDMNMFGRLLALYDNIAAALRWCLDNDADGERGLLLCSVLWGVVHQGHVDDIAALSDEAVRRWPDPRTTFAADAMATAATAKYLTGDAGGAIQLAELALPAAESSPFAPFTLRRVIGYARRALGDAAGSMEMFQAAAEQARRRGMAAMAMEAEVTGAQLLADAGDADTALRIVDEVRAEAVGAGSDVNEVWARTVATSIRLRVSADVPVADIGDVLARARRIDYPGAIVVNLRLVAQAHLVAGRQAAAARAMTELFDEIVARGALADLRNALYVTAVILERAAHPAWSDLAATAASLPIVGMMASIGPALFALPDHAAGAVLGRREAIVIARRELRTVLDETPDEDPDDAPDVAEAPDGTGAGAGEEVAAAVFAERGEMWEISYGGSTIHVKGSKGIADLALLLAAPNRELHCLELMGTTFVESSTGAALDATARRRYEERARELQAEIDSAERDHDTARADRARIELDTLVDHLTASFGLGGRPREAGGSAERARSAVTQRLRATIKRLGAANPALGRHLTASIATGTYCSYRPEQPVDWQR